MKKAIDQSKVLEQQTMMIKMTNEINAVLAKYGMPEIEEFEKPYGDFISAIEKELAPKVYEWRKAQNELDAATITKMMAD